MVTSGLLIASGLSSRISGFKPLLQYERRSFLITIVEKLLAALSNIVIVVGHEHLLLLHELETHFNSSLQKLNNKLWQIDSRITILFNENYQKGMFTSLQLGTKQLKDSDWILYHFIDQPNLPKEFYSEILKQHDSSVNLIQPVFMRRSGHPILFDKRISSKIIDADYSSNLREVLNDESLIKRFWNCDFPEIFEDIDTDDDYQKLLQKK